MSNPTAPSVKTCKTCDVEKVASEFWRDASQKDGLNRECRDCVRRRKGVNPRRSDMIREKNERRRLGLHLVEEICRACATIKPLDEFPRDSIRQSGRGTTCRTCSGAHSLRNGARARGATSIRYTSAELSGRADMFGNACWMCGATWSSWDHVKPVVRGGMDCLANLRPACTPCNSRKNGKWLGVKWAHDLRKR